MIRKITAIITAVLIVTVMHSSDVYCAFNDMGWGVRPMGMGGAYTGVSDDCSAIHYNPGGLAIIDSPRINLFYSDLFTGNDGLDISMKYSALVVPLNRIGVFGLSWANFNLSGRYVEDTITFTYSREINPLFRSLFRKRLVPEINVGLNLKSMYHSYSLDERTENDPVFDKGRSKGQFSADIGVWLKPAPESLTGLAAGIAVKNINQPDVGLKTEDQVPLEVGAGVSYRIKKVKGLTNLLFAIDMTHRNQDWGNSMDKKDIRFGTEGWLVEESIGLRLGVNLSEISSGFTLKIPEDLGLNLKVDYAFLWPIYIKNTIGSHRVSLTYLF